MPSYARKHQLGNSLVYHVFNRSNAKKQIFNSENDYQHFVRLVANYQSKFEVKIYHWAIMPNHYHLLLELEEPENISILMAGLNRAYTHYHHKVYSTSGFLWEGRFKLRPVQKEKYLISCGRYIERNPIKANLVLEPEAYQYSSARFYCLGEADGITTPDPLFEQFGAGLQERRSAYREFLSIFDNEEEKKFENFDYPLGDKKFIKGLIYHHGHYMPRRRGKPIKRIISEPVHSIEII